MIELIMTVTILLKIVGGLHLWNKPTTGIITISTLSTNLKRQEYRIKSLYATEG